MADDEVHTHIEALVAEEHKLWQRESSGNGGERERERLAEIKVELDRYWDLLRRRRSAAARAPTPRTSTCAARVRSRATCSDSRRSTVTSRWASERTRPGGPGARARPERHERLRRSAAPRRPAGTPRLGHGLAHGCHGGALPGRRLDRPFSRRRQHSPRAGDGRAYRMRGIRGPVRGWCHSVKGVTACAYLTEPGAQDRNRRRSERKTGCVEHVESAARFWRSWYSHSSRCSASPRSRSTSATPTTRSGSCRARRTPPRSPAHRTCPSRRPRSAPRPPTPPRTRPRTSPASRSPTRRSAPTLGARDRLQRGRQSQRARRLGHGGHRHLVRQDLRHRPLQRLGACERVQPVLGVARRHRGGDRPYGIDVHAEGRGRQLHRPRQRQGRRAHDDRHVQRPRGPDRDGGVPARADVGDESLLRALQLTRRQRLRRLRQRQPRLRDGHDQRPTTSSPTAAWIRPPASSCTPSTAARPRASRPAATPPTARRSGRRRRSCSPTDGRTCPTTSSS